MYTMPIDMERSLADMRTPERADPARGRPRGPGLRRRARPALAAILCALLALTTACDAMRQHGAARGDAAASAPGSLDRIEIVTGGANAADALPLVVAVHGLGDSPEGLARLFQGFDARARIVLPRAPEPYQGGGSWFPLPWDPGGAVPFERGIASSATRIVALLDALPRERPTRGRPILTGFSQGGILAFAVAATRPDLVSAVVPIAGWLPPALWPRALPPGAAALPVRALHGADDPLLAAAPTRDAVEHLRSLGFDAQIRIYPGVGHTVTPPMLRDYYDLLDAAVRREAAAR